MDPTHYGLETFEAYQAIDQGAMNALARDIYRAWEAKRTVFTCGNGGSYSNAQHLAQDLREGTRVNRLKAGVHMFPPLRTHHLGGNPSLLTALANDEGYASVFFRDLYAHGHHGDLLIAISGSGNSENVLQAVEFAHELEMRTWGVCGFDGGRLLNTAHRCVHVRSDNMGIVEAVHGIVFHWLVERLRKVREGEETLEVQT